MRIIALDSWRGISALMVVLYHFGSTGPIGSSPFVRGSFLFVDFFFVLSGFVIHEAYQDRIQRPRDVANFLARRLARIAPLHVFTLTAFIILEGLKLFACDLFGFALDHRPFTGPRSPASLPYHFALLQGMGTLPQLTWNAPNWSISVEFWVYLVFGIFTSLRLKKSFMIALGIISCSVWILCNYSKELMDTSFHLGFFRCLYGFFLGIITHDAYQWFVSKNIRFHLKGELLAIAITAAFVAFSHTNAWSFFIPWIFAFTIVIFARSEGPIHRALALPAMQCLGKWSYSIYLVHFLLLELSQMTGKFVLNKWSWMNLQTLLNAVNPHLEQGVAHDLLSLVFSVVVIFVSSQTYRIIEDPSRKVFNRIIDHLRLPNL